MRIHEDLGQAMEPLSQKCMREFWACMTTRVDTPEGKEFHNTLLTVLHEMDSAISRARDAVKRAEQAEAQVKRLNVAKAYLEGQRSTIEDSMYDVLTRLETLHNENNKLLGELHYARETITNQRHTIEMQSAELRKVGPELDHLKAKIDPVVKRSGEKSRMLNRVHGEITHYFETMDAPGHAGPGDYDAALAGHRKALRRTAEEILALGRKHTREFGGEILPENHVAPDEEAAQVAADTFRDACLAQEMTLDDIKEAGGIVTVQEAMEADKKASGGVFNSGAVMGTEKDREEYQRHPAERPDYLQHKAL